MQLIEDLDTQDCFDLLGRSEVGRVITTVGALPAAFPVNYVFDQGAVHFFTAEGTKYTAAVRNAIVAFEVDDIDPTARAGWSVLVVGQAQEVADPSTLERVRRLGLQPWVGERHHLIVVPATVVTGRRVGATVAV